MRKLIINFEQDAEQRCPKLLGVEHSLKVASFLGLLPCLASLLSKKMVVLVSEECEAHWLAVGVSSAGLLVEHSLLAAHF